MGDLKIQCCVGVDAGGVVVDVVAVVVESTNIHAQKCEHLLLNIILEMSL